MRYGKCSPEFAGATRSPAEFVSIARSASAQRGGYSIAQARYNLIAVAEQETNASDAGKRIRLAAGSDQLRQRSCCNPRLT